MSLFERINNKIKEDLIVEKDEFFKLDPDEEKVYKRARDKKAKELGYKSGADLERAVDRGIKAVDKKPGGRYPSKGYATGEPFQSDTNKPQTGKPGTGKYRASGKSTLYHRLVKYPSMDKGGETAGDVKKRLERRIGYVKDPKFDTPEKIKNVIKKATSKQGPLSTATGKDSTLYKTIKRDQDLRNPTIPSKAIGKDGKRLRVPMPGGYDPNVKGGRTGTKAQQVRYDAVADRGKARLEKELIRQAKIPKDVLLDLPRGGTPKTVPFNPKEFNLQFKADKMKIDYGGRMAEKDPMYKALTDAQKKKRYESIKKTIYNKKSSQPSKAPIKFSTYKYDSKNVVPTGLKGRNVPKFRDINRPIAYKQTTGDAIKAIEKSGRKLTKRNFKMQMNKQPLKFASLRKPSQAVKYKKTFGDFAKNVAKGGAARFNKLPLKGKLAVGALAIGGTAFAIDRARKALTPGRLDPKKDFTPTSAITDTKGKKIRFKYDTYNPATKTTTSAKNLAGPTITKDQLGKFDKGEYNIKDQSGKKIDLRKNIQQSAFTKQLKDANKGTGLFGRQTKKDKKFLQKYKKAAEYRGIKLKGIK